MEAAGNGYPSLRSPDLTIYGNPETPITPSQNIGPSPFTDVLNDELRTPSFDTEPITNGQTLFLINTLAQVIRGGWYDSRLSNADIDSLSQTSQDAYKEKVKKPIDLNRMKSNLKGVIYASVDAFFGDVDLLVSNMSAFYGSNHTSTRDARKIRERLLAAMVRLPKQTNQVPSPITPKSEPSPTGKKRTNDLASFFKPMSELSAKRTRGDRIACGMNNTSRTPTSGFRMPPFFKQGSAPATPCPVAPAAPMYHVAPAPPVAHPLVPEELIGAQQLMSTLADAITKVSEAHPQMAQRISELDAKVSEATEKVAQALSTMQRQMKAMEEVVTNAMTAHQELQERCAKLETTISTLGGAETFGGTGALGGVGTGEVVDLNGAQLPNNMHLPAFLYELSTSMDPPTFPFA